MDDGAAVLALELALAAVPLFALMKGGAPKARES